MRGRIAPTLVLVFVLAGCSDARGGVNARRLALSWSTTVGGSPGAVASDGSGTVVSVDDDSVVALDRAGIERWSSRVAGAGLGWPLLGGGVVVVPTRRDRGGPGGCVALDRAGGARVWAYEERDSEGVAVARADKFVVCAFGDGVVVAVDATTGARRWRVELAPLAARSAVVVPERTALAVDHDTGTLALTMRVASRWYLATLDLGTGSDRGSFDFRAAEPLSAPVSTAPGLLAVGVSGSREVCALDLRRGRADPCVAAPVPDGFDPASIPVVADGVVVIAGRDGSLTAVDLAARKVRWSVRVPAPILGARPVVDAGIVMFSDWSRVPWAVHLADGSPVAVPASDGWVVATVADTRGGFEVAKRDMDGGWIERWAPVKETVPSRD